MYIYRVTFGQIQLIMHYLDIGDSQFGQKISNARQDGTIMSKWKGSLFFKTNLQSNFQINLTIHFEPWTLKVILIIALAWDFNTGFYIGNQKNQSE